MIGALGGVTAMAMVLQVRGFRPAVILMWGLFVAVVGVHTYAV